MKSSKCFQTGGICLPFFLLVSSVAGVPYSELLRLRRDAEPVPEPEISSSTTTMATVPDGATPMMPTMMSTTSQYKQDPMDMGDGSGSDEMSTTGSSSTDLPESSTGKSFGGKVKDAVHSAEGWIKNAGQNIKNSWDKAKESVKETANNVKEKGIPKVFYYLLDILFAFKFDDVFSVKKGIDSAKNARMHNSTSDSGSTESTTDCKTRGNFFKVLLEIFKCLSYFVTIFLQICLGIPKYMKSYKTVLLCVIEKNLTGALTTIPRNAVLVGKISSFNSSS